MPGLCLLTVTDDVFDLPADRLQARPERFQRLSGREPASWLADDLGHREGEPGGSFDFVGGNRPQLFVGPGHAAQYPNADRPGMPGLTHAASSREFGRAR
jgi:hypothetical protein